ncbi:MAG: hypothetical protein EOL88_01505 [Bacteroidia bacterium]|nr:hypothetical protein [Bacteroidia bacterium]
MILTDKIYVIENQIDVFGDIIPTSETSLDCRIMSTQIISENTTATTKENRYETKLYIPYRNSEPYISFGKKEYKMFRIEDIVYELVMKVIVKDFFGTPHHYELIVKEH